MPYLLERVAEPLSIDLRLERLAQAPRWLEAQQAKSSVYRVAWPFERLPSPRLVLTTSARVFQRAIVAGVEREPDRRNRDPWFLPFARDVWAHTDQDHPAAALTLPLASAQARDLFVIVEEGDNTPLPLATVRVLLPAYRLRFFRDQGAALRLATPDGSHAPRYDPLLAPQLLGVAVTEIAAGNEEAPRSTPRARPCVAPPLLGVLGLAVLVLSAMIPAAEEKPIEAPALWLLSENTAHGFTKVIKT